MSAARAAAVGLLVALGTSGAGAAVDAEEPVTALVVDASAPAEPVNRHLVGLGWHPGGAPLSVVEELDPSTVRIDASLQDVSPGAGELHLTPLLDHVAQVRSVGAEPLVILSYMPAWLGAPHANGRDPTRVAPADPAAWEELVHDVVLALATAPAPARRFEAWNEPDIPLFWQDTPAAWSSTITHTARAIARVEVETGLDLEFGGPATAFPDPVYLGAFLTPLRDTTLPLDFVSWHYYGNSPFLGPDGNEFSAVGPLHPVIGQPNPLASPASYGPQVGLMRSWTTGLLAGTGRPLPIFVLDEWNLSPGGFDRRHDTHEGAAFAAGVLVEMQQAGLDQAAFFRVDDARPPGDDLAYGGHGAVHRDGTRKPVWWSFWLWQQQPEHRVPVAGADATGGLWATAAADQERVTVLVASFSASRPAHRTIDVVLEGLPWSPGQAAVWRIDGDHAAARAEPARIDASTVRLDLPPQAVALLEVRPSPSGGTAGDSTDGAPGTGPRSGPAGAGPLPATGGGPPAPGVVTVGLLVLATALAALRSRAAG